MNQDKQRKFKILIVDDVPKNIQVVASILQPEGYQMAFAQNGKAALEMIQSHPFDLILLDVMMPEMDGFNVCCRLKADPTTSDIPVIFLTAKVESENVLKGFDCGAVDYVTKPFNGAELLARVRTHLALRRARQDLQEANATKDKFFSIIAHDLKNPFNAVLELSKLLLSEYDTYSDDRKKDLIQHMKDTCSNTYRLLLNLLEWSRIQTGKIKYSPDRIDLYTCAFENVYLFKTSAAEKNIRLTSQIVPQTMVYADPNMITTVIRNLVSNAIKFTRDGGEVIISAQPSDSFMEITVSDTGIGINETDIPKLFRIDVPFTMTGTAQETGTGLGLILCKEFVEKNGGRIWVESEYNKGTRLKFTVPKENRNGLSYWRHE